jgi:hypothetical protein
MLMSATNNSRWQHVVEIYDDRGHVEPNDVVVRYDT